MLGGVGRAGEMPALTRLALFTYTSTFVSGIISLSVDASS